MNDNDSILSTLGSGSTGNYYNYNTKFSWSWPNPNEWITAADVDKEELLKKLLESEDEFMPILKKYLVGYLDKIMENPEPIIKDLIREKDSRISELEKKISDLEKMLDYINGLFGLKTGILENNGLPYTTTSSHWI